MRCGLWGLAVCVLPACGVAFSAGLNPAPAPAKSPDTVDTASAEEKAVQAVTATSMPAVGLSLVIGGTPLDAGPFPPPPIPVVVLP